MLIHAKDPYFKGGMQPNLAKFHLCNSRNGLVERQQKNNSS